MPTDRETLEDRMPCIPGVRHTFGAFESRCLCGALQKGVQERDPVVFAIWPSSEKDRRVEL